MVVTLVPSAGPGGGSAGADTAVSTAYRANDYADGQAMSILPPGENGLVNAVDAAEFELLGQRPADSQDQLGKYANLLYGASSLTDATLGNYYNDESFGVPPGDVMRTERPGAGVTIYRDTHDVPHVYGNTDQTMAFGAGYAQAEDRLFLMDVLRHYGEGTLASFLGGSCEFEQMDHDQLLLAPYTPAQAQAQVDALPGEYGAAGHAGQVHDRQLRRRRERLHQRNARPTRCCCRPTTRPRCPTCCRTAGPSATSWPSPA